MTLLLDSPHPEDDPLFLTKFMASYKTFLKSGHPPTLLAAFLYFDFSFAAVGTERRDETSSSSGVSPDAGDRSD